MPVNEVCAKCGAASSQCNAIGKCLTRVVTPVKLAKAWKRYTELFGVVPHGTTKQLAALLELVQSARHSRILRRVKNYGH
jgi:hypothetical protein